MGWQPLKNIDKLFDFLFCSNVTGSHGQATQHCILSSHSFEREEKLKMEKKKKELKYERQKKRILDGQKEKQEDILSSPK